MDLGTVSLILSVTALLVSILTFFDNRKKTVILKEQNEDNKKKTGIMSEQLKLLKEQAETKRDFVEIVDRIQTKIAGFDVSKYSWGEFNSVASRYLLDTLHDSGKPSVSFTLKPLDIFGETVLLDSSVCSLRTFDAFKTLFEEKVPGKDTSFEVLVSSRPEIRIDPNVALQYITVKDYVTDIYSLQIMLRELKSIQNKVSVYAPNIISHIEEIYIKILKALYERLTSRYELVISSKIKAKELPDTLLNSFAFDVWKECVYDLKNTIRNELYATVRRMRESV